MSKDRATAHGSKGRIPDTAKRADIVLFPRAGVSVAVIEAKNNSHRWKRTEGFVADILAA